MSSRNSARSKRSLVTGPRLVLAVLSCLALAGCVSGELASESEGLQGASAGEHSFGPAVSGAAGASQVPPQAGSSSGTAGSVASGGAGQAGSPAAGGAGNASGAPSAGGAPGGAGSGSAGMTGSAGAPPVACPNKRGIAYAFAPNSAGPDMAALKGVSWFYGWAAGPSAASKPVYAGANMEFVPMIWNGSFKVADAVNAIPAGSKYLLGFNEPNFGSQGNLTPEKAAQLWPQVEQIAAQKQLQIVSPATNYCAGNCNRTDPFVWLDDFFKACPGCKVDYIGVHWYACTIEALKDHVTKMKKYNKPIWVTEYACVDGGPWSVDQVKKYAEVSTAWLEQEPSVFRYSWFSGRTDISNISLLGNSGALTTVGTAYVNAPHHACP